MKLAYDPEVDALYLRLIEGAHEVSTQRLSEEVAINYAPDGRIVGVEILDTSVSIFPTPDRTITVENLTPVRSPS